MLFIDRTSDFRELVHGLKSPESRRPRLSKQNTVQHNDMARRFLAEAYVILNHINTLTRMLSKIRRPYLSADSRIGQLGQRSNGGIDLNSGDTSWEDIRHLSNEERDQIDTQARVILGRCADRINEMEVIEKKRADLVSNSRSTFSRLIPLSFGQDENVLASDFLAAHHSSVTWFLNRRLADASQTQKEMQEERIKRQLERTRTLGSIATLSASSLSSPDTTLSRRADTDVTRGWSVEAVGSVSAPPAFRRETPDISDFSLTSDDEEEIELSASQIQQFEQENNIILNSVQDTLESVQQAESRLMDISALQMELVTHLTRQTELTDQLYEDAIATTSTIEKGNAQLREAKRRAKDSRLFILVFLIGASFSLLFLHYY